MENSRLLVHFAFSFFIFILFIFVSFKQNGITTKITKQMKTISLFRSLNVLLGGDGGGGDEVFSTVSPWCEHHLLLNVP